MSKIIYVISEADGPAHSAYTDEQKANEACKKLGYGYYVDTIDLYE